MTTMHVSFSELTDRLIDYERLPVPVSATIQSNLRRAVIGGAVATAFFAVGPRLLTPLAWSGFFVPWDLVDWPAYLVGFLAEATAALSPVLLVLNLAALGFTGYLYWRSKGFAQPVEEALHWLAGAATLVAAISILSTAFIVVGFLTSIAFALALWILIGLLILLAIIICFGVLGLAAGAR